MGVEMTHVTLVWPLLPAMLFALLMALLIALVMALWFYTLSQAQGKPKPSFNCAKARAPVEILICSDTALARQDATMARNYRSLRAVWKGRLRRSLKKDQRRWVLARDQGCRIGKNTALTSGNRARYIKCLMGAYRKRNALLERRLAQGGVTPPSKAPSKTASTPEAPANIDPRWVGEWKPENPERQPFMEITLKENQGLELYFNEGVGVTGISFKAVFVPRGRQARVEGRQTESSTGPSCRTLRRSSPATPLLR